MGIFKAAAFRADWEAPVWWGAREKSLLLPDGSPYRYLNKVLLALWPLNVSEK